MGNKHKEKNQIVDEKIAKELEPIYKDAACKGCPSDWFFPEIGKGKIASKRGTKIHNGFEICKNCKVKELCFNFAMTHGCMGIWGGRYFTYTGVSKTKIR